ncbi:MAG TPA: CopG family transcriptional regulator [Candidatus Paceibacterota bacterium]|nr:CopG family transcriptional regulator [Candidatus Paceibacterota bacterium]
MPSKLIQARADDETVEALEDFAERNNIDRSEAIRRAVRGHLGNHGYDFPTTDGGVAVEISELEQSITQLEQKQSEQLTDLRAEIVTRSSNTEPEWVTYLNLIVLTVVATLVVLQFIL